MKFQSNFFIKVILSVVFIAAGGCNKKDAAPTAPVAVLPITPLPEKPYSLVWSDEFDKDGVPEAMKWGYDIGGSGWGNNELQYYTSRPENARVTGGNLVIETKKEAYLGRNYTSARLLTKKKAEWTYGRFEIRAKIPAGKGTWPAIWLLSAKDPLNWPEDGELDIMEEVGFNHNLIHGTVHNKNYNGANGKQKGSSVFVADAQTAFHIYTLEWTPTELTWFVDGKSFYKYDETTNGATWPYYKDFFMILNTAVGGNWGGLQGIDDSVFPQQMLVDYVRVYQRK